MQVRKFSFFVLNFILLALILQGSTQLSAAQKQPASQNPAIPPAAPPNPGVRGPFVGKPIVPASFDGDVRRLPQSRAPIQKRQVPRPVLRRAANAPTQAQVIPFDPVRQAQMGTRQSLAPLQSFDGLPDTGWYPPSSNGDVGPNDYVQAVNIEIGIYSKTGTLLTSFTYDQLFSPLGGSGNPCSDSNNRGDVIVVYDPTVDRWIIADMAHHDATGNSLPPYYECIAVSKTSDPVVGGWWLYALPIAGDLFNDFAKLGVWSDGIYMSANLFDATGTYFQKVRVWALNRDDMINDVAMQYVYFDVPAQYASLLPSNLRGSTPPPASTPDFFASIDEPNTFHLWKFHVDWNNQANSTFTGPTDLTVANFVMPCNAANTFACVPELNGEQVDAIGDRLSMQLQYRNFNGTESLWANHTVAAGSAVGYPTGVRWYEIRDPNGTPFVYQQGTYQPDSNYRWMGSLAVDQYGNMALGYSISSASMYPAIRYAGRLVTDTLGTLQQGEVTLVQGTGSQNGGYNRWGDYSAMTIDPTDDCTFWYTNEYYTVTGGSWQTRIGSFRLASPVAPPPPSGSYIYYFPFISRNGSGTGTGSCH